MKNSYITVTDQFCGAGGNSQGVRLVARKRKLGTGLEVKLAMNHWALAIETHNTNFPETDHVCTDISACDPRRYHSTHVLVTSPECTVHSPAGGGAAKKRQFGNQLHLSGKLSSEIAEERSRATMWDVCRFAEYHGYEIIIVENVVEARKWVLFDTWLKAMINLGYDFEIKYINSMHHHPTPQSRDRMYIIFWKKGRKVPDLNFRPVAWCSRCTKNVESFQWWKPKKTGEYFGKYKQQYVYKCPECDEVVEPYFYAAFNCIDWSRPGIRIGDRDKPLSPKTSQRCQYGIDKFWDRPGFDPLVVSSRYIDGIDCRVKSSFQDPLPTQVTDCRQSAMFHPLIIGTAYGNQARNIEKTVFDPLRTQTTRQEQALFTPILIKNYGGPPQPPVRSEDPLGAITCQDHHGLINWPLIVENHGTSTARPSHERLLSITTERKHGLITSDSFNSFISYYYGGSKIASHITEPMRTVTTKDRMALIKEPYVKPKLEDCYYRMLLPPEIQAGMAFDRDYVVLGNSRQKVKQLGNAVTPPVMASLIDRCIDTLL